MPVEYEVARPTSSDDVDDPVVQAPDTSLAPTQYMPSPNNSFAGISNTLWMPPDTNGDVGPDHYVQATNAHFRIWNKAGTPLTSATSIDSLFAPLGGNCANDGRGDPIVLYDQAADRWLVSEFAFVGADPPFTECVAISTGPNPAGTYYLYSFESPNSRFPDYPKFGVWPDGYYMSANEFNGSGTSFLGVGAWVWDRAAMILGDPTTVQYVHLGPGGSFSFLPADMDGSVAPPVGAPNPFFAFDDFSVVGVTTLESFNFHVDWATPANTTFTAAPNITVADLDSTFCSGSNCISQPSTTNKLDPVSDRLMNRLAYRNFGTHEAMVVAQTVDTNGSNRAGIRWYELRKTVGDWGVFQQGTYSPDSTNRFLPSAAIDGAGNIAIGYSVASSSVSPSIRYAGRLASDPLGALSQGETTLVSGSGSQTGGGGRWGDYSMLSVDPADDCTFWFTSEYYTATSSGSWATRIGSFTFPECLPTFTVDDVSIAEGDAGSTNAVFTVTLDQAQGDTVTVDYDTSNGSATAGSDYTSTSGTLTFLASDTEENFSVPISGDTDAEGNETFTVTLSSPSPGLAVGPPGTGTITNDDPSFSINDVTVTEGDAGFANASFTVSLSPASGAPQSVDYTTQVGSAVSPDDYTLTSGTLNFLASETSMPVDVPIAGELLEEADETFTVVLSNGTLPILDDTGSGTITDDDSPACTITGNNNNNTLIGTGANDVICGGNGDDILKGRGGNDTLLGQIGNDNFRGGGGADICTQGGGTGTFRSCETIS